MRRFSQNCEKQMGWMKYNLHPGRHLIRILSIFPDIYSLLSTITSSGRAGRTKISSGASSGPLTLVIPIRYKKSRTTGRNLLRTIMYVRMCIHVRGNCRNFVRNSELFATYVIIDFKTGRVRPVSSVVRPGLGLNCFTECFTKLHN